VDVGFGRSGRQRGRALDGWKNGKILLGKRVDLNPCIYIHTSINTSNIKGCNIIYAQICTIYNSNRYKKASLYPGVHRCALIPMYLVHYSIPRQVSDSENPIKISISAAAPRHNPSEKVLRQ
jgi:hypothetical protein